MHKVCRNMLRKMILRGSKKGGHQHVKSGQRYEKGVSQHAKTFKLHKNEPIKTGMKATARRLHVMTHLKSCYNPPLLDRLHNVTHLL
jgi:hypothetical protein